MWLQAKSRHNGHEFFSAHQLQEKSIEHHMAIYQVFVDLTKAFDTVCRTSLWTILGKLGFQPQFVNLFKPLQNDMEARPNITESLSEPFSIDSGVKQEWFVHFLRLC